MDKTYTISKISAQLGIAESTLRRYVNRHGDYIPSRGVGRKRRYLPTSMEVFTRIADLYAQNYTYDQVTDILKAEFPTVLEVAATTTATQPQQPPHDEMVLMMQAMAQRIMALEEALAERDQVIQQIQQDHHTATTDLLEGIRKNQEKLQEKVEWAVVVLQKKQKRPWWRFW